MDRQYAAHTSPAAPELPVSPATGFPRSSSIGQSPTQAGPYWFHMITESLRNVITGAGLTPDAADLTLLFQAIQAMVSGTAASAVPTGTVAFHRRTAAPAGWVALAGGTIGNADSGATARANADTAALFELIWTESDNTAAPIQTNAGAPTTRGASAGADFAAGKRLPLDDARGEFLRGLDVGRGVDVGRVLGSAQADALASHTHTGSTAPAAAHTHPTTAWGAAADSGLSVASVPDGTATHTHSLDIDPAGGAETRPRNRAYLVCIKL